MSLQDAKLVKGAMRVRKIKWDRDELIFLRHVRKLSFPQIALRKGCDHTSVMYAMKRLGIFKMEAGAVATALAPGCAQPEAAPRSYFLRGERETEQQSTEWSRLMRASRRG